MDSEHRSDRVLRTYAHTAWTSADPLAGLDPEARRQILLMPSTFRERWKVAPWTNRHQRRMAIFDIIAERRLQYELNHKTLSTPTAGTTPTPAVAMPAPAAAEPQSPYYQYRMVLQQQALDALKADRRAQDLYDRETWPEARANYERRQARFLALLDIDAERARLDLKEIAILAGREPAKALPQPSRSYGQAPTPRKRRERER